MSSTTPTTLLPAIRRFASVLSVDPVLLLVIVVVVVAVDGRCCGLLLLLLLLSLLPSLLPLPLLLLLWFAIWGTWRFTTDDDSPLFVSLNDPMPPMLDPSTDSIRWPRAACDGHSN